MFEAIFKIFIVRTCFAELLGLVVFETHCCLFMFDTLFELIVKILLLLLL